MLFAESRYSNQLSKPCVLFDEYSSENCHKAHLLFSKVRCGTLIGFRNTKLYECKQKLDLIYGV